MSLNKIFINNSDTSYTHSIFDISEYTGRQYSDLSSALADVPTEKQSGGMTVRYVRSSDNKYVQYRLMADTWSTTVSDWQGVDDEPTSGSDNLVKSMGVYKKDILKRDIDLGINLFDKNSPEIVWGHWLNPYDGSYGDSTNTFITHYIKVNGGEQFKCRAVYDAVSMYDEDMTWLGSVTPNDGVFTVDADARFIRITCAKSNLNIITVSKYDDYVGYSEYTENDTQDKTYMTKECLYQYTGKNQFNKNDSRNKIGYYLDEVGGFVSNAKFFVTHPIKIEKDETLYVPYGFESNVYVAYKDSSKVLKTIISKTIPYVDGAQYVLITGWYSEIDKFQVLKGNRQYAHDERFIRDTDIDKVDNIQEYSVLKKSYGKNLFNKNDAANINGAGLDPNGNIYSDSSLVNLYGISHYIPVVGGRNIYANTAPDQNLYCAEYDANLQLISTWAGPSHTLNQNAAYIRCTLSFTEFNLNNASQVEYGTSFSSFESFTDIKEIKDEVKSDIESPIKKKRILWLGTSIPAGYAAHIVTIEGHQIGNAYPNMVGYLTDSEVINVAVGSQRLSAGFRSLVTQDNPLGFTSGGTGEGNTRALMHTIAQKQDIIDNWSTYRTRFNWTDAPETLDAQQQEYILGCSYENCVIPYLNGTYDKPDIIIIDHGVNDQSSVSDRGDLYDTTDLCTFYGAYNFLVNLIHTYDRSIRIFGMSYFLSKSPNDAALIDMQKSIADANGLPFCELYKYDGWDVNWTQEHQAMITTKGRWNYSQVEPYASLRWAVWEDNVLENPTTMYVVNYHCPDGIHPHSDMSGQQNRELAYAITWWIRNIL